MNKYPDFTLEFNNIFRCYEEEKTFYQKGIHCRFQKNLLQISEIVIKHPGTRIEGFAELYSRFYEIGDEGAIKEIKKKQSCPCNNDERHIHNLKVLILLSELIEKGKLRLVKDSNNLLATPPQ